jgi:hypothetical protein
VRFVGDPEALVRFEAALEVFALEGHAPARDNSDAALFGNGFHEPAEPLLEPLASARGRHDLQSSTVVGQTERWAIA